MYAVGHLALGYLSGKAASEILRVRVTVPLLFLASVVSDADLLFPSLQHRGPTHSLIVFSFLFLPTFLIWRKKAAPYYVGLAQHSLVGDLFTGEGVQLLWPVTSDWYGLGAQYVLMASFANILLEWMVFLVSMTLMYKMKDVRLLFERHFSNLLLLVPVLTVLLPTLLGLPLSIPVELVVPHLAFLVLFTMSILTDFKAFLTDLKKRFVDLGHE